MSDEPIDPDVSEDEPDNAVIRNLREQAKGAKAAEARADAAERKLAFVSAGIDPEDPRQSYFAKGYSGDLTPDAIRAEATAAGFLGAITTSEPEGMTDAERAAFAATGEAAASGVLPEPEKDIYEPFRGVSHRGGESPESFGMRLAQTLEAAGEPVSWDGPLREGRADTGFVDMRTQPKT